MTQANRVSAVPRAARFERPRTRLLAALAEAVDVPLVVLAAPSGYGKTTLLAQYARSTSRRVAWCRLGGVHEGPGEVVSRLASQLPELTRLRDLDARTPAEALATVLAGELATLDQGTDLIVDNLEDEALARWLDVLASQLEEGHRLLIGSHSTGGFRLAHRLADASALLLDSSDLAFDPAEILAYLGSRGSQLSSGQLQDLAGWPAGLALCVHGMNRHAKPDDLVLEALQALPAGVLAGLPLLAPLDFWNEADAALLSPDLPSDWLRTLVRAGLPLSPLGSGVFQPHGLLVRVLERLLGRMPERARQARAQAARLTEAAGALERAANLYIGAGELDQALRLAEPLVLRYRERGEHRLIRSLLERLATLPLPPALQERLAWAQIETGSVQEGEACLTALKDGGQLTPGGFACLAMVRGRQGQHAQQLSLAQQGLALVRDGSAVPALFWPLVFASLRLGLYQDAEQAAERFLAAFARGEDRVRLAEAWQLQGVVWRHTRPANQAREPLIRARAVYEDLGWHGRAADLKLDELELSVREGALEDLVPRLAALASGRGPEHAVFHVRRLRLLSAVERRQGHAAQAETALNAALDFVRSGSLSPGNIGLDLEWADYLLGQGRPLEAGRWLTGEGPAALTLRRDVLHTLLSGGPLNGSPSEIAHEADAETRLRAWLLLAAQGVTQALGQARNELAINPHAPYLPLDRALLGCLSGTPAAGLLQAAETGRAQPEGPAGPRTAESAPVTLTLTLVTLGDLRAEIGGGSVHIGLAKARELLVWLALHGSGSRDELVTALWDGSAEERHIEYFRVAVRRLRGVLKPFVPVGLDPLPYTSGRYRLAAEFTVNLDVLSPLTSNWARPFLPGVESEWAQDFRLRVFQQGTEKLLEQARAAPMTEATGLYRQVLLADPLIAAAHEGLIAVLARAGDTASARQALSVYSQMLDAEYGSCVPSDFLDALPAALVQ